MLQKDEVSETLFDYALTVGCERSFCFSAASQFIDARAGSAVLQITPVIQITKLQSGRSDGHFLKSCYEELTFNYNVDCHRYVGLHHAAGRLSWGLTER
jgi:hypothetical protein